MISVFNISRRWMTESATPATVVSPPWHIEFRKFQDGGRSYTGFVIENMRLASGTMTFNNFPTMMTVLIHK